MAGKRRKIDRRNIDHLPDQFANSLYDCQRKTPLISKNEELLRLLEIIERQRYLIGNERSALSYRRAISAIRAYPKKLESYSEAIAIKGIGTRISKITDEYIQNGYIKEVNNILADKTISILGDLARIYGIGPTAATRLFKQGVSSVKQLKSFVESGQVKLSPEQVLGLKYVNDFDQPMSREAIESIAEHIEEAIKKTKLPNCLVEISGGYRRGKTHNNDADILVSPSDQESSSGFLQKIIQHLQSAKLVVDIFSGSSSNGKATRRYKAPSPSGNSIDQCFCVYKDPKDQFFRRLDIVVVPKSQFAFASLGWTGSGQFERSIRLYASKEKGLKLNSNSLIDRKSGKNFHAETEKEIFEILGLQYIPPEFRNC